MLVFLQVGVRSLALNILSIFLTVVLGGACGRGLIL